MLGNSLVLKQRSPYYEHFYIHLRPDVHYVPVQRDLSDLVGKIEWAKSNDAAVEEIARQGQARVRQLLQPNRLYCYYYRVLEMYSKRQTSRPTLHLDMELVSMTEDTAAAACTCDRKKVVENQPTMAKVEL